MSRFIMVNLPKDLKAYETLAACAHGHRFEGPRIISQAYIIMWVLAFSDLALSAAQVRDTR